MSRTPALGVGARVVGWIDRRYAVLLVLPGLLWMLGLLVYPVAINVYYSFTNRSLQFPGTDFVAFENYARVLSDRVFWSSAVNSIVWTATSVSGQLVLGFVAALSVERLARGRTLVRVLLIIPWVFSAIVMASVWRLMLDPLSGVFNALLVTLGLISEPIAFFGSSGTALGSAVAMNIWFGFPFMFITLLAGLATISDEYYEAAAVDGAGYWRQVWHITLPALKPIVATLVVLRTIWVMNNFDFVFLATGGGPRDASLTLPVYAFRIGWTRFDVGRMAAVSIIMTLALVVVVLILLRLVPVDDEPKA